MGELSMTRGAIAKRKYRENPDHRKLNKEYRIEWDRKNPLKYMLNTARRRAKICGHEFTITEDDFTELPTHCPVLKIELRYGRNNGKRDDHSPSLDRKDSSKGYVPGNVEIMSWRANNLKSNATLAELEQLVEHLRRASTSGIRQGAM